MPYRVNKRKKVVEVNGDVDLSTIWRKVQAAGGPEGWKLSTYITAEEFGNILERLGMGEGQEPEEDERVVIRGFRPMDYQVFAENNLLKPLDDEEEDEVP